MAKSKNNNCSWTDLGAKEIENHRLQMILEIGKGQALDKSIVDLLHVRLLVPLFVTSTSTFSPDVCDQPI